MELTELLKTDVMSVCEYDFKDAYEGREYGKGSEAEKYREMDVFEKYFTYKASDPEHIKSVYEAGKEFARKANALIGNVADCDGSGERNIICEPSREIYRILWGWQDIQGEKRTRYASISEYEFCGKAVDDTESVFKHMGPDTMNSVQTILKDVVGKLVASNESFRKIKGRNKVSSNYCLELFANNETSDLFIAQLKEIAGLKAYIRAYHTLGNFTLVPAGFNSYRGIQNNICDYWDRSLKELEEKQGNQMGNQIYWNKQNFAQYVNRFFMWDYVDETETVLLFSESLKSGSDIENYSVFMKQMAERIQRRGMFMYLMLKLAKLEPSCYELLVAHVFSQKDRVYKNYAEVFAAIRKQDIFGDERVQKLFEANCAVIEGLEQEIA